MIRALILLLLLTVSVEAQQLARQAAFFQQRSATAGYGGFYPTNLPGGISATAWWEVMEGAYKTNGGTDQVAWTNLTANGPVFDLTNTGGGVKLYRNVGGLNGRDFLQFPGTSSSPLRCNNYTSPVPHEVFMVLLVSNAASVKYLVTGFGTHSVEYNTANTQFRLINGATLNVCAPLVNRWCVLNFRFDGANSTIFTNGVAGVIGNAGSLLGGQLHVGSTASAFPIMNVACIITFTNTLLTATQRSNVFWYCTNRFNLSP